MVSDSQQLATEEYEQLIQLQASILGASMGSGSAKDVVAQICRLTEPLLPQSLATVLLRNGDGKLDVFAAPNVPSKVQSRLSGLQPGPETGSCANAVWVREPVYVADTMTDPRWKQLRSLAVDFGIMACWSIPIRNRDGQIIGTFALSSFVHRSPSRFHKNILETVAVAVSMVLEHHHLRRQIRLDDKALESISEGVLITGADQNTLHLNAAFTRITGYSLEDFLGQNCNILQGSHTAAKTVAAIRTALSHGESFQGEILNYRKNGTPFWNELSINPVHNTAREITHFVSVQRDVTETRRLRIYTSAAINIQQDLLSLNDPQAVYQHVVDAVLLQTEVIAAWVLVPKAWTKELSVIAVSANEPDLRRAIEQLRPSVDPGNFPYGNMVPSRAFREKITIGPIEPDQSMAMRAIQQQHMPLCVIRSVMAFPIFVGDDLEPSAVLAVNGDSPDYFTPDLQRLLGQLVASIGLTLTQLRHHQDMMAKNAYIQQMLSEISGHNERLLMLIEAIPDAIFLKDSEGRWQFINEPAKQMLQLHDIPWQGKTERELADLQPAFRATYEECLASDEKAWQAGHLLIDEETVVDEEGQLTLIETRKVPMFGADGQCKGLVIIGRDITERKQAEEKLHLAANVFTHAREGIMITNADGTIIDVNDGFTRITGYNREEVLGQNPRILVAACQGKEFYAPMKHDLAKNGHWHGEIWAQRKNREVYAEMLTISAVHDVHGNIRQYVGLFTDISTFKEYERQLEYIAHHDTLTNLPNRVLLADRLQQGMAQAHRHGQWLAVAYLDLDGFKTINDNYGHEVGDQLLMTIATRMKPTLREGETLARLGGDEFVAVLLDLDDIETSTPILARLLAAAAQPVYINGTRLQVSASIGVTFYPQEEEVGADQLLRQADQAMYQAKLAGKNRYHVFNVKQDRGIRGHHESLERIRRALTEREFVLYYQPKVNMRTGTVIGAEAMIRWQHPGKGLLLPAAFLPIIENHPLFLELGEWVIDTALAQIDIWHAAGLNIPVSVNVGAYQLQQADFVERLQALLAMHPNIGPGDLELEVLETSALQDLSRISQIIEDCRGIGVSFALDDFGTGYSSLTYLKHLRVDLLKIDQSFVRDMLSDPDDMAILDGVISLAAAFRCKVIAEGVETVEHGEILLQLGCELAQGYGIARLMPAHEFPGWSAAWRPDPAWADRPAMSRNNLPLLFAGVEHRAWTTAIENFLMGKRNTAPLALEPHQCHFGIWLNDEGMALQDLQPAFLAIEQLHHRVHALALDLLELQARGRNTKALARLSELHDLRDALLQQLKEVIRVVQKP
ncbi:MAG: EAL domain-containing protein [Sulfuriferula sp.]